MTAKWKSGNHQSSASACSRKRRLAKENSTAQHSARARRPSRAGLPFWAGLLPPPRCSPLPPPLPPSSLPLFLPLLPSPPTSVRFQSSTLPLRLALRPTAHFQSWLSGPVSASYQQTSKPQTPPHHLHALHLCISAPSHRFALQHPMPRCDPIPPHLCSRNATAVPSAATSRLAPHVPKAKSASRSSAHRARTAP